MKENCPICYGSTTKKSNFSFKCNNCKFYFSNLKPSAGKDYSGIENVRRKNFKKLISVIYTYKKNLKYWKLDLEMVFFWMNALLQA